jgi:uncharacterized protein
VEVKELSRDGQERIIRGQRNWWFIGPGGLARLRAGHLTSEGTLTAAAERGLRARGLFDSPPPRAYALTVLTSTACNLGCGYCFQNTGQDANGGSRPPRIASARLTSAGITSILEFASRQMGISGLDKLNILLFGGEPLLNLPGCLELLARAADYGRGSVRMISNLTLLTPDAAVRLSDLGLRDVQVTFDGDREEHDKIRVNRSGGGSFDVIVRNMALASAAAPLLRWAIRVNVSHNNYPGIDALVDRLAQSVDVSRCRIYFAQVGDVGIGYANELLHSGELSESFSRWQRRAIDLGFSAPLPSAHVPCYTCGYGDARFGAVVNADGTLSSCWETAGKPDWRVGTVTDGYLPAEKTRDRWITCGDLYRQVDSEGALASFRDTVDADLLDCLDEAGRLGRGGDKGDA